MALLVWTLMTICHDRPNARLMTILNAPSNQIKHLAGAEGARHSEHISLASSCFGVRGTWLKFGVLSADQWREEPSC